MQLAIRFDVQVDADESLVVAAEGRGRRGAIEVPELGRAASRPRDAASEEHDTDDGDDEKLPEKQILSSCC